MMKQISLLRAILFWAVSINTLWAQPSAKEILERSDQTRNAWNSFLVKIQISNYNHDQLKEDGAYEVMIKGDDKSLVRFLNPDQKGQYLLMLEDNMWIYLPDTKRPIRITPLQRLMGDASNGDVARTNFARDYAPEVVGEEKVNGEPCYRMVLTAKREGATYARVEYWVSRLGYYPRKAELYLSSGKNYKSIHYDKYETILGKEILTQMTLVDRLREQRHTVMKYLSFKPQEIPEKYFNKNYMEQLK